MENYDLKKGDDGWKLQKQGAQRASEIYEGMTKQEAVREAAKFMNEHPGSMKIRKENGRIQEERTYPGSADPRRTKG